MRHVRWVAFLVVGMVLSAGCVSVKAPEKVDVRVGSRPEPVDSDRVPATASHEEARAELHKAYRYISYLERENDKLEDKNREYKRQRDKYKKERDKYKDRLEDYEDD